jgi:transcriptional regulator with XRE-family HTH domain
MRHLIFAYKLRRFRISNDWDQGQIAKRLQISRARWYQFEHGLSIPANKYMKTLQQLGFTYKPSMVLIQKSIALFVNALWKKLIKGQRLIRENKKRGIEISQEAGLWIREQLKKKNILIKDVANKIGCSSQNVTQVLNSRCCNKSKKVQKALAETLGYSSFEAIIAAARGKGGAE